MQMILNRANTYLSLVGLGWFIPIVRMATGESPAEQFRQIWRQLGIPLLAIAFFIAIWSQTAPLINTSLGAVPGPVAVWEEARNLVADHREQRAKRADFYARQQERNTARLAEDPTAEVRIREYTGKPSYFDQIVTSLKTVFTGFVLAALIGVPLGILAGLSPVVNSAINPLVQVFKPVSPLAWLPIVTMVVSAVYVSDDPLFEKSFVNSAITVTLCSLWPALINTALGVASIDKDLINVGRVLKLGWWTKVRRIVLPSALIAAEMLAQNPGLGKFVWDEFQNGSSESLARILVAVFTIGLIGFLLDRVMLALQTTFTHSALR
jgi:nitrate/nitrite transport system permease protein